MSELSHSCGSEGYKACDDDRGGLLRCCRTETFCSARNIVFRQAVRSAAEFFRGAPFRLSKKSERGCETQASAVEHSLPLRREVARRSRDGGREKFAILLTRHVFCRVFSPPVSFADSPLVRGGFSGSATPKLFALQEI